jgi:DNA polymerase-3 subunit delta'
MTPVKTTLRHNYLLVGNVDEARSAAFKIACDFLRIPEEKLKSHPDFSYFKGDFFGIDSAREIKERSFNKSFLGHGRVFVIEANSFSKAAANALLKTFEEPTSLSYFLVITEFVENILPTLRSRLTTLTFLNQKKLTEERRAVLNKFLKLSSSERIKFLKRIVSNDRESLLFLDDLHSLLREKLIADFSNTSNVLFELLLEIERCRRLFFQPGHSVKLIFDHISLIL